MENKTKKTGFCEIGMVGLGVMGRNLLLNMAEHNHPVAGFDTDLSKVDALRKESSERNTYGAENLEEFIGLLASPRKIMLLVPAGRPVDAVIEELLPFLQKGDIIIDGGNSYYKDTEVRIQNLAKKGVNLLGVGISGGEKGAREGPSIMPGGDKAAYEHVSTIFKNCSAKVNGEPCVAYLGPRSSGHFVKMVHNGIEYGIMQLISETYDILKRGLRFTNADLKKVYADWNEGELNSYLLEITSNIFGKQDDQTGKPLIDEILDVAKQLGTGMWTSQSSMELQVPTPIIDVAVGIRNLSMMEEQRELAHKILQRPIQNYSGDNEAFLELLRRALYVSMLLTYAQGMALLGVASVKLNDQLNLETVARIWRGGCIIRAGMLEDIRTAYKKNPQLPNLILDQEIAKRIMSDQEALRSVLKVAIDIGVPVPGLMSALSYLDGYRSGWLPANLIQSQRDYFGAHTYERKDEKGTFHTHWENAKLYENQ
jgi:6-phosphogluconate dehydrogenase